MAKVTSYSDELRLIRSLLIVTSLQKRHDLKATEKIQKLKDSLDWEPLSDLMIDAEVWRYAVRDKGFDPRLVFCHPDVLLKIPVSSLYYRGLCGLSMKIAKSYFGAIENLESGNPRARIDRRKAWKMATTYNTFICSIIKNSTDWTLENGYRTIIATIGITLDGRMRNKIGDVAEERIKTLLMEWLIENKLVKGPTLTKEAIYQQLPKSCDLVKDFRMIFGSEPDVSFYHKDELLAVIEIKGGTDAAGALERYGAATKSFQHSLKSSKRCRNFYLAAVFTPELERRMKDDRLVEKVFDIVDILDDPDVRTDFFAEIFHHTLRLI